MLSGFFRNSGSSRTPLFITLLCRIMAAVAILIVQPVPSAYGMSAQAQIGNSGRLESEISEDTLHTLQEVAVVAHLKQKSNLREEPLSSSVIRLQQMERAQILTLNDFSYQTPNLYIPDYGSKITSSIYIRGLGSRIDNPAVGLYVDNIPYLNKNGFDTDLWDIMRMEVLRGPQSTLYGRNTIGGIINISTLSPMFYQGTRISAGYGNGNSYSIKGSTYWKLNERVAFNVGANYSSTDGFYTNSYNNKKCDWINSGSARARVVYKPGSRVTLDNTLLFGRVEQGGYAYSLYDPESRTIDEVNYNDPCGYERTTISDGLSATIEYDNYTLSSVTSWQYLDDCMTLDQDFTPKSMFTLKQAQHENTFTEDIVLKNKNGERWQWITGLTLFYKSMKMQAPVRFKKDGINELILFNVNNGIHQMFPQADIIFQEDEFDIHSNFKAPVFGAAAYHQSEYKVGRFTFTAGLRLDYEHSSLDYSSESSLNYRFTLTMPQFRQFVTKLDGKVKRDYFEPLPKLAVQYSLERYGNLYLSVSKGFKAGGYNTQMFSDILQNKMMTDMMADLGVYFDNMGISTYSVDDIITYKPEHSWNYEVGGHFNIFDNKLEADASLFYIDCTNQQLTVFPGGKSTGRMMTNAGQTRSLGAELSLNARPVEGLTLGAAYGYTNAKFVKYNNGITDFKDNFVPYVPKHTLSANGEYTLYNPGRAVDKLSFRVGYNGIGKIYWDEANSVAQEFYSLLSGSIYAEKGKFSLELWGKNLTSAEYTTFYFVSIGNTFLSQGKPATYGVTISVEL